MARSLQRRALVEYLRYPTVFAEPDPPSPRHRLLRSYNVWSIRGLDDMCLPILNIRRQHPIRYQALRFRIRQLEWPFKELSHVYSQLLMWYLKGATARHEKLEARVQHRLPS